MIEHLRFTLFPTIVALCILAIIQGNVWAWFGVFFFVLINLIADDFSSDYFFNASYPWTRYLNALLWSIPILQIALLIAALVQVAAPDTVLAGYKTDLEFDLIGFSGTIVSYGIVTGITGVSYAHELIHRKTRFERVVGQVLVTLCMHPSIAIEHIYGHHVYACTSRDPTLAARGMGFWQYLPKCYFGEIKSASSFENRRLSLRGQPVYSPKNRFLQGLFMQGVLIISSWILAGPTGVFGVVFGGAIGLVVLELGNYITHYGIVREPGQPMEPRHSWNAPRIISTSILINAPRHSDHHSNATAPFWKLTVADNAPTYSHGNFVMSVIALIPPIWIKIMGPPLEEWDRRWATPGELTILKNMQNK